MKNTSSKITAIIVVSLLGAVFFGILVGTFLPESSMNEQTSEEKEKSELPQENFDVIPKSSTQTNSFSEDSEIIFDSST